jgi:hypothetical protein
VNKRILILLGGAFVTASAINARAADPGTKPETLHQAQENEWLEAERQRGSSRSFAEIPFPVPGSKLASRTLKPETPHQAAENAWLTRERDQEAGNTEPVPYPVPADMSN